MAKQLYDYWFVQFDFPDENGRPYKSSGGEMVWNEKLKRKIPASWENKNIEDIADVYNGATPSTINEQNYGGDIVWITPKDLSDQKQKFVYQGERNISQAGYNSCSTHLLPPNTILMSSRAPICLKFPHFYIQACHSSYDFTSFFTIRICLGDKVFTLSNLNSHQCFTERFILGNAQCYVN